MNGKRILAFLLSGLTAISSVACGSRGNESPVRPEYSTSPPITVTEYIFAIHPLHNPERLFEVYGPLMLYLSEKLDGISFSLVASRNYDEFDKRLFSGAFHFALPNPWQTLQSFQHGYRAIAKMGDDHKSTGVILVRRDSGITEPSQLKGKKISYPAPTALAATMMPQYYFQTHGLNVMKDAENLYVGSQESSIMNVYLGLTAAGATWPFPWETFQKEHPEKAAELRVAWETKPLINNGIVVRNDVPPEIAEKVRQVLTEMHTTACGKKILSRMPLSRFERADNNTYRVIEHFIKVFAREVRPPEGSQ